MAMHDPFDVLKPMYDNRPSVPVAAYDDVEMEPAPPSLKRARRARKEPTFRHKDLDLVLDDRDRPVWCMANAMTLLSDHADWRGVLGYNEFTGRRVLLKAIPGERSGKRNFPRNITDDDYSSALQWFNRNGFPKASAVVANPALRKVAAQQAFDPLVDYLDSLKWDGTRRIDTWLTTYCGVESSRYVNEVGRRWLISAVARAYQPGCKADCMLVLEGKQGARKSSALKALAGEEWFTDALPPMNTKDASSFLQGRWIVEVAELEAMRREVDAIKAFLTRTVESYRPAYGHEEVEQPRRCIFAGTTNKDDWLKDDTGGRRFWPVKAGEIDVTGITRDRGQIWAEAVAAYSAGERHWLTGEVEKDAVEQQTARRSEDPWEAEVLRHAASCYNEGVACRSILEGMGFLGKDMTRPLSDRVAAILRKHGYEKRGLMSRGDHKGSTRFVKL